MNIYDDMKRIDKHEHLWILKKDGTVYCYDCGILKEKDKK